MPRYQISSMLVSLTIIDTPVEYTPPKGPAVPITLTYNQRESQQPATFSYFNLGQKWTFNWLTYIQDDPNTAGSKVARYVAGGGIRSYTGYSSSTGQFSPETHDASLLVRTSSSPIRYERRLPDGGVEVYSQSNGATAYPRKIFLTSIADPAGNTVTLSYDGQLRLTSITDVLGQSTTLQYTSPLSSLLVTGVTDPFGRTISIGYDSSGRLNSITDAIGMTSTFGYDSGTFINTMITPYGTTRFAYGDSGGARHWLNATDPLSQTERVEYYQGAPGIPYSESQVPSGMATSNAYLNYRNSFYWDKHAFTQACTLGGSYGATCDFTKARIKHFLHVATNTSLTARVLESIKYPLDNRIWFDYPGQSSPHLTGSYDSPTYVGRVLDDGSTQLTTATYNSFGKPTKIVDALGRETDYFYASNGIDLTQVKQKNGSGFDVLEQYTYNSQHEPLTYTDAAGQTTTYTYNAAGQLWTIKNAANETTTLNYDGAGYLVSVTNPNGSTQMSFTYDSMGRVATSTDSEGYTVSYQYDALNRVTQRTYPDGTARVTTWDKLDISAETDRQNNTTIFNYDAVRNLTQVTDPLSRVFKYDYYENGKLKSFTDPKNNLTSWSLDLENRVVQKTYPDLTTLTLAYDKASRLKSTTDALGQVRAFTYGKENLLRSIAYSNAVNATPAVTFNYDSVYPRVSSMLDGTGTTSYVYFPVGSLGANQLASADGPYSNDTVSYAYDVLGRVMTRTVDTAVQTFGYDSLGRVASDSNPLGAFTYTYLGQTGQPTAQNLSGGYSLAIGYDGNNGDRQLQSLAYRAVGATIPFRSFVYTHSAEHLVTGKRDKVNGNAGDYYPYSYDTAYRLTAVGSGVGALNYGYDDADNLTGITKPGYSWSATTNANNQLATVNGTTWQYDADGHLLNDGSYQYSWDAEDRLLSITNIASGHVSSFRYDGLSRRVAIIEQDSGGSPMETRYLWCGDAICQQRNSSDTVLGHYYSQGEEKTSGSLYYVQDHLGSVAGTVSGSGTVLGSVTYGAYGTIDASSGASADFGFAGMLRHSATGNSLTWYRLYNAQSGRWLSRDPIGEAGGFNVYAYVEGNPVSFVDPLGLDPYGSRDRNADRGRERPTYPNIPPPPPTDGGGTCSVEGQPDCGKIKDACIAHCSDTALPTPDYGFLFWNCLNKCMLDNGC